MRVERAQTSRGLPESGSKGREREPTRSADSISSISLDDIGFEARAHSLLSLLVFFPAS